MAIKKNKEDDPQILEAKRNIENAKQILREKAGREGDYYTEPEYVSMACRIAWNGVLIVAQAKMIRDKHKLPEDSSDMNIDIYRDYLKDKNESILKCFNSAYNYLCLLGEYDENLHITGTQTGFKLAEEFINWCK